MRGVDEFASFVSDHSRIVIAVMVVLTLVVGAGATAIPPADPMNSNDLVEETDELAAIEYIGDRYAADDANVSTIHVYVRADDGNVLSKESLLASLRYQQTLYDDPTVSDTLVTDSTPIVGVENVVATAAMGVSKPTLNTQVADIPLDKQIAQLESMNDEEVAAVVETVLSGRPDAPAGGKALTLLPLKYEPSNPSASARAILVSRDVSGTPMVDQYPPAILDGERALATHAAAQTEDEYFLTTYTILAEEDAVAITDSLLIVGPLAILLIIIALAIAYRDLLDIVLGIIGILVVLIWSFGLMGWVGIPGEQFIILVVPVLLIGLSIDYAIHTFMRHREERAAGENVTSRTAMYRSLAGVGLALLWVTVTTGIGFLSNLTSPFAMLRNFGIATTLSMAAALLIFTTLIPALKIELDGILARFGRGTPKRAFGTGDSRFSRLLTFGTVAARRAPMLVIVVALLTTSIGVYGGLQLNATVDESGLADDAPAWMHHLPEPFKPSDYTAKEKKAFVDEQFRRGDDTLAFVLVRGAVTNDDALERIATGQATAADSDVVLQTSDGEAAVTTPLSLMKQIAAVDPAFREAFENADTDGNGVPDRDIAALYDRLFAIAPNHAASVIERAPDGTYRSLLVITPTKGDAEYGAVRTSAGDVATAIQADDDTITATPTGERVIAAMTVETLLFGVIETLLITLGLVVVLLMVGYRLTEGSATLGFVTLLPVAFGLAWFFGTLWLFDITLTLLNGVIASLTIGLGVDYSIHLSERYKQELARQATVWDAMDATLQGTGGALVGGFATTLAAFGTLALATVPSFQQFGILIGIALIYAFCSTLVLLPCLLVVWTRYFGPDDANFGHASATPAPVTADD